MSGTSLEFRRYRLPFRGPVRTAHGSWPVREGLIVRLETPGGAVGWGEAAPLPDFGTETADAAEAACRALGGIAHGAFEALPPGMVCLRQALRMAEAELAAGANPAGGADHLAMAALLPAGKAGREALGAKAELGFRVFKWKVGVGDDDGERSLLDDLCGDLPTGAKLRLDANGAWDRRRAERWLDFCADRPVEFVEQPVAADARGADDLLFGLAGDYPTPIALDESLAGGVLERWLGAGWPGVFVVKPSLFPDPALTLDRLAAAKADVVLSSALETAVGARAMLRLAFGWKGGARAAGFGVWPLFRDPRFDGPAAVPFVRRDDVERIDPAALWSALS